MGYRLVLRTPIGICKAGEVVLGNGELEKGVEGGILVAMECNPSSFGRFEVLDGVLGGGDMAGGG